MGARCAAGAPGDRGCARGRQAPVCGGPSSSSSSGSSRRPRPRSTARGLPVAGLHAGGRLHAGGPPGAGATCTRGSHLHAGGSPGAARGPSGPSGPGRVEVVEVVERGLGLPEVAPAGRGGRTGRGGRAGPRAGPARGRGNSAAQVRGAAPGAGRWPHGGAEGLQGHPVRCPARAACGGRAHARQLAVSRWRACTGATGCGATGCGAKGRPLGGGPPGAARPPGAPRPPGAARSPRGAGFSPGGVPGGLWGLYGVSGRGRGYRGCGEPGGSGSEHHGPPRGGQPWLCSGAPRPVPAERAEVVARVQPGDQLGQDSGQLGLQLGRTRASSCQLGRTGPVWAESGALPCSASTRANTGGAGTGRVREQRRCGLPPGQHRPGGAPPDRDPRVQAGGLRASLRAAGRFRQADLGAGTSSHSKS